MDNLFETSEAGIGLDAQTRAGAAEAWERLDDMSRLLLPSDESYWVDIQGFKIGRHLVTVGEYAKFISDGGPEPVLWEDQKRWPYRPVVRVNWHEAVEYGVWASHMQVTNIDCLEFAFREKRSGSTLRPE